MVVEDGNSINFKPARLVSVGDEIWSAKWNGLEDEFKIDPYTWQSENVDDIRLVKTTIKNIIPSIKDVTLIINEDNTKRFSLEQTVLTKKNDTYYFGTTGILEIGDILVERKSSGDFVEIEIKKIDLIDEEGTIYQSNEAS